jgi:hypothetical protein
MQPSDAVACFGLCCLQGAARNCLLVKGGSSFNALVRAMKQDLIDSGTAAKDPALLYQIDKVGCCRWPALSGNNSSIMFEVKHCACSWVAQHLVCVCVLCDDCFCCRHQLQVDTACKAQHKHLELCWPASGTPPHHTTNKTIASGIAQLPAASSDCVSTVASILPEMCAKLKTPWLACLPAAVDGSCACLP